MDINGQISEIISRRMQAGSQISSLVEEWKGRRDKAKALLRHIAELRRVCESAMTGVASGYAQDFNEILDYLKQLENEQWANRLQGDAAYALAKLGKLSDRFMRNTIHIAVAGVGRCGKSTALKSIIGQSQEDNSTIPSGNGPAITAGKSTIVCVETEAEEKSVVRFHTAESFLNELINPLLQDLSLEDYACNNLDDFEGLDFEELKRALLLKQESAQKAVKDAEREYASQNSAEAKVHLDMANAFSSSFNQKTERLSHLGDIIRSFPHFRGCLTGGSDTVPLTMAHRFVSYPRNGDPAVCYAVKECRIYSRFPNNTIQNLELVDLPGLGTGSQSERKCFLDGFNYTVDLALMIRRPEGLFQNFTTDDDLRVMEVIGATFGEEHLHECMVLFQNDANLPQSDVETSYQKIEQWNAQQRHPLTVIRGDAHDTASMQKSVLPKVLDFMMTNLPALDKALMQEILPELEKTAAEFDSSLNETVRKLSGYRRLFRGGNGDANAVTDKARELRDGLMNGLNDRMDYYGGEFDKSNSLLPDKIQDLTAQLKTWAETAYSPKDEHQLERVRNEIRRYQSAIPYANGEIHQIRIHISEVYSELEKIHVELIEEVQQAVADIFWQCFPKLLPQGSGLQAFIQLFEDTGDCLEITDALKTLLNLEVPFYNIIYPDLRVAVFDSVSDVEKNFQLDADMPLDKKASIVLGELQNTAFNWIWKAENVLESQNRIRDIILATLERLQDRLVRSRLAERELNDFIERYWSDIKGDDHAFEEDIHAKLDKIQEQCLSTGGGRET